MPLQTQANRFPLFICLSVSFIVALCYFFPMILYMVFLAQLRLLSSTMCPMCVLPYFIMCTFTSVSLAQLSLLIVFLSTLYFFSVNVSPFAILSPSDNAHCVYTYVSPHVDYSICIIQSTSQFLFHLSIYPYTVYYMAW